MIAGPIKSPVSLMSLKMFHAIFFNTFLQSSPKLEHSSLSNFYLLLQVLYRVATQSVVHGSAALKSLGSLLERQYLGLHPRGVKTQNLCFHKIPGVSYAH